MPCSSDIVSSDSYAQCIKKGVMMADRPDPKYPDGSTSIRSKDPVNIGSPTSRCTGTIQIKIEAEKN